MGAYKDKLMSFSPVFVASYNESDDNFDLRAEGSGVTGTAVAFTGTKPEKVSNERLPDDFATKSNYGTFQFTNVDGIKSLPNGFTVVALVKSITRNSAWDRFISFGRGFINGEVIFSRFGSNNDFSLSFWNGSSSASESLVTTTGNKFTLNEYHHIVGVYDRANNETRLYLNGVLAAVKTSAASLAEDLDRTRVGVSGTTVTGDERLFGLNILPAIYDKVLSETQIAELASLAQARTLSGVVKLTDTDLGASRVAGLTAAGLRSAFSISPDSVTGAWTKETTKEPLILIYTGPSGYLPQAHGPY